MRSRPGTVDGGSHQKPETFFLSRRTICVILFLLLWAATVADLLAVDATEKPHPREDWLSAPTATGDWWGARTALAERGLILSGAYVADFQSNVVGGKSAGFAYFQQLYLQAQLDLEKVIGWRDANFYFRFYQMAGSDLSNEHIGNYFDVAELASINTLNVSNIYLDQKLLDDRLWLKVGRLNVSKDFGSLPIFGLYVGVIDAHPPSFDFNTFYTSNQKSTWGLTSRWRVHEDWELKYGLYQATTEKNVVANHGLNMLFQPSDGIQQFWEIAWTPTFGKHAGRDKTTTPPDSAQTAAHESSVADDDRAEDGYSGIYNFGVYYTNWSYTTFSGQPRRDNYGFYALAQQLIWKERPGSPEGLTAWGAVTYSPLDEITTFPLFVAGGLVWQGLIPGRDQDSLITGSYYGILGREYAAAQREAGLGYPTYEWVLELGYVAHLTPWLYVTPDIQWVIRPGGTGSIPNALVLGWELGITF